MKRVAIIGGGISGLSTLHFLRHRYADRIDAVLYEKDNRLGGTIGTDRKDGYISDWGPNGFLDKVPLTLQMVSELELEHLLEPASPKAEKRFIYRNRKLHEISPSPLKFMRSPLLSITGRMRLVGEPFIKQKQDESDESIFNFAARRIGTEAAETLIVPMVSGIYGGDARKLSLKACFPVMVEMEQQYGSLIKAMIAKKKEKKSGGPAGPSGHLTSFKTGLYRLIEELGKKYHDRIESGREVVRIEKRENDYSVRFLSGQVERFDAVVCATPAYAAAEMVTSIDNRLADVLKSIPYASISVVCLGYRREQIKHDLSGFGFLIPRNQEMRILGSIWTSSIFKGRAPDGMVQLRVMIGGATDSDAIQLPDEELIDIVHSEMSKIVGIDHNPNYVKIYRWPHGIPQFVIGHTDIVNQIDDYQKVYPGLFFTGNAYDGIGLNDCVMRADKTASQIARIA